MKQLLSVTVLCRCSPPATPTPPPHTLLATRTLTTKSCPTWASWRGMTMSGIQSAPPEDPTPPTTPPKSPPQAMPAPPTAMATTGPGSPTSTTTTTAISISPTTCITALQTCSDPGNTTTCQDLP